MLNTECIINEYNNDGTQKQCAEIKNEYRKKSLKCHPDKGGNEEDFKKLKPSYEKALIDLECEKKREEELKIDEEKYKKKSEEYQKNADEKRRTQEEEWNKVKKAEENQWVEEERLAEEKYKKKSEE